MAGVNKVLLIGRLGKDPEVKYSQGGSAFCSFSLATSESWKDKQTGEKKERTEWHNIIMFGKVAEIAGEYLKKGSQVYLEGSLQTDSWEKDGVKRYTTKIKCHQMQMLDKGEGRGESRGDNAGKPDFGEHDQSQAEDNIPF